ncbi:MAG: PmoA family protein [Verrucomicrobiota bacterium]
MDIRQLILITALTLPFNGVAQQQIHLQAGKIQVAAYQAAPLSNPAAGDQFKGSNFIHPLKTPSGFVVTDSMPEDHPHHFGLWWPWKFVEVQGRKILCWELQQGQGIVEAREHEPIGNGYATHSVYLDRQAERGPKAILKETTRITTSPLMDIPADGYLLDLSITQQCAGDQPVTIPQYRYSGFALRATPRWNKDNSTILTSAGKDRYGANKSQAAWIKFEGEADNGSLAGVLMMGHPKNHSFPERLRTWDKWHNGAIFINFNPVQDEPWIFSPGKAYTRQYRLFIYDGTITADEAEALWQEYAG